MDVRRSFVADHRTGAWTMTELCAQYGISRQAGYELLARVQAAGDAGLAPRSRRPHHSPTATSYEIRAAGGAARARRPRWGPRPLRRWLIDHRPNVAWPSRSTFQRLLAVAPPRRRQRPSSLLGRPTSLRPAPAPNAVWTIDFKGDFRLAVGSRCYPLTLRDLASRFALRIDAFAAPDGAATQARLARAFAEYGLPACLRSDNGPPFAGPGLAGLSQLNVWCLKLGIAIEHIAPGRPDQNGSHEQFHRILKAYTIRPPAHSLRGQQRRFDAFRHEYNHERPHQALADTVPARHYQPSPRQWSGRVPRVEYPGHWEPRRVQPNGRISFAGASIFLSRALAGEWVALEEVDEGTWTIYFSTVPLARWLTTTHRLRPIRGSSATGAVS
jgi:transposase InsO family protein